MQASQNKPALPSWLPYGIAGFLASLCLSVVVGSILLTARARTPAPTETPTPTEARTPSKARSDDPLDLAERAMDDDSPEKVKDLLLPHLKNLHTLSDLARAYRLLGDAEWMIGHYQLAAAYYEKLFAIEPTFDNLLMLAYAYDAGGNLELAYQKYYLLANMEGEEVDGSRADIEMRLEYLEEVLTYRYKGTHPAPPPTFTPQPTP